MSVAKADYKQVADACTLCDMCFMTKCPYVPPHEFNVDFPHLMLRYRAVEHKEGKVRWPQRAAGQDRPQRQARRPGRAARQLGERPPQHADPRRCMEKVAGIDRDAALPKYHGRTFVDAQRKAAPPPVERSAPAFGRKAVLYATCFVNYNNPGIGEAAQRGAGQERGRDRGGLSAMLRHAAARTAATSPRSRRRRKSVAAHARPWIDKGYDVIALVPSCALMLKFEWPLIVPDDAAVAEARRARPSTSANTSSASPRGEGLAPGLGAARRRRHRCTSPATPAPRTSGQKAAEMLRLLPETEIR